MKNNHMIWMILACAIPMLMIVLLPIFGITSKYTTYTAIAIMVIAHVFMMISHKHEPDNKDNQAKQEKDKQNEHH